MSRGAVKAPSASPFPSKFGKQFPNLYLPNTLLYPSEHGNPGRKFNDQELGELAAENKAILPYAINYKTWATNTDVLTSLVMPKVKLREGVQRVEGKVFQYNIVPTTAVPPRGTVRFMSKEVRSFSLAIGQKGIGSKFEGRALRSEYGPTLLAMEIQAIAESISLGMAINTGINLVNAAIRYSLTRHGPSYMLNLAQEQAREMGLWCRLGADPSRIAIELNRIVNDENPSIDTLLVPSTFTTYENEANLKQIEVPITRYAMKENQIVEIEDKDSIVSVTTFVGGRVKAYVCPTFRYGKRSMELLSTISRIGEVYPMFGEFDAEGRVYLKSSLDIYVYDETEDDLRKLQFDEGMQAAAIWEGADYDKRLVKYVADLNNNPEAKANGPIRRNRMFPISVRSLDSNKKGPVPEADSNIEFYLPNFIINLDQLHLSDADLNAGVRSVINNLSGNGMLLSDANDDMNTVNSLRVTIEEEPYEADYWKQVIALNINRSVRIDPATQRAVFVGSPTSEKRARANKSNVISEWTPNRYGSLDIPIEFDRPAGMWSAGGLLTIANTKGHPLQRNAQDSYNFLKMLAERCKEALMASVVFNSFEMPVNMPKDDVVQLVMTTCFGPRVPVFLAAPLDMASPSKAAGESARAPGDRAQVLISNVVVNDPELKAALTNAGTGSSKQGSITTADQQFIWRSPTGLVVVLPAAAREAFLQPKSELFVASTFASEILGDLYAGFKASLVPMTQDNQERKAIVDAFYAFIEGQVTSTKNQSKAIAFGAKALDHASALVGAGKLDEAFNFMKQCGDRGTAASKALKEVTTTDYDEYMNECVERYNAYLQRQVAAEQNVGLQEYIGLYDRLAAIVKRDIEAQAAVNPGFNLNKKFWSFNGTRPAGLPASYTLLAEGDISLANRPAFTETTAAIGVAEAQRQSSNVYIDTSAMDIQQPARVGSDASLLNARYYRTPLVMSYDLLATLVQAEIPLILPGDPVSKFEKPSDLRSGIVDSAVYDLPHYFQSRSHVREQLNSWTETGIYSRIALINGKYAVSNAGLGSRNRTGFGIPQGAVHSRGNLDTLYQSQYDTEPRQPASQQDDKALVDLVGGNVQRYLSIVHGQWSNNFVTRFAAMAYLLTPLTDIEGLRTMIRGNVMPPFGMFAWRLRSDHEVYSFLACVAGMETGANFYNGAHFDWAQDATRDVYQTRAVITTDAHVIRPENTRIIPSVMPAAYRGGHDSRTVRSEQDLKGDNLKRQNSVIYTISSLSAIRTRSSPLSMINMPPAEITMDGNNVQDVDADRQYFAGAQYYAKYVYPSIFGNLMQKESARSISSGKTAVYKILEAEENHIAMNGFHIRFDYPQRHYCRDKNGNGHRADKRLNLPGARAYLNGETTELPRAKNSIEFLLT